MVVTPKSRTKLTRSMSAKKEKMKSPDHPEVEDNKAQVVNSDKDKDSQPKRNNNPGIRVIHGRIYDSQNGKTCHQCRQKTRDFAAGCKNVKKTCPIRFCHKCLLNRYGEKAEEVGELQEWVCPKCRGICNCSVCMKKRGHQPTGILIRAAKTNGFSSVSEMLQIVGPDKCQVEKSAKKRLAPEGPVIISPPKRGKENNFDGITNSNNFSDAPLPLNLVKDKSKKVEENKNGLMNFNKNGSTSVRRTSPRKAHISHGTVNSDAKSKIDANPPVRKLSKKKNAMESSFRSSIKDKVQEEVQDGGEISNMFVRRTSPRKHQLLNGTYKDGAKSNPNIDQHKGELLKSKFCIEGPMETSSEEKEKQETDVATFGESGHGEMNIGNGTPSSTNSEDNTKHEWEFQNDDFNSEIQLPDGFELTRIHDIEMSPEDVGKAFQFLEFCAAFGKILGVKKGQPEIVLRDVINGRSSRRGKHSVTVQFLMQLLSVIRLERGHGSLVLTQDGKNSWKNALRECISESGSVSKLLDLGSCDGFEYLDSSKKLMVINFLCDEILGTEKFRNWIDEKTKEHKEKVTAAKDKEKNLKQQVQDEIAKAIIEKNGATLTISEHDAIISKIKHEAAAAHAKLMELNGSLLKQNLSSDVVRTRPLYLARNGRAYWRLNCLSAKSASEIFLQDIGSGNTSALDEKWFAFEDEQREEIEKHINSLRGKRLRAQRIAVQGLKNNAC